MCQNVPKIEFPWGFLHLSPDRWGALFYPGGCYAVYNTRDAAMKWKGMGEFKALHTLTEVARLLRFREGLWSHSGKFEVVCFPQQAEFVHRFLGERAGADPAAQPRSHRLSGRGFYTLRAESHGEFCC